MAKQFTLGKDERLKSRKQTELLFSKGKKFSVHPFRIFYTINDTGKTSLLFGVAVSSKLFKKAVDRNRIKRLIREAYRLQKNNLQGTLTQQQKHLAVFIIYVGNELPDYHFIFEKMGHVINRLIKITDENN